MNFFHLLLVALSAVASPPDAAAYGQPPTQQDARLQELLKERRETLAKCVDRYRRERMEGRGGFDDTLAAEKELLEAELSLADKREDRVKSLAQTLARLERCEREARLRNEVGTLEPADLLAVTAARQAVAIQLAREENRAAREVTSMIEQRLRTLTELTKLLQLYRLQGGYGGRRPTPRLSDAYRALAEMNVEQASSADERVAAREELVKRLLTIEQRVQVARDRGAATAEQVLLAVSNRQEAEVALAREQEAAPATLRELLNKRRKTLQRRLELMNELRAVGNAPLASALEADIDLLTADLEGVSAESDRIDLARRILEHRKAIEQAVRQRFERGMLRSVDQFKATSDRLKAEIDLLRLEGD